MFLGLPLRLEGQRLAIIITDRPQMFGIDIPAKFKGAHTSIHEGIVGIARFGGSAGSHRGMTTALDPIRIVALTFEDVHEVIRRDPHSATRINILLLAK